jgi:hypothetical protein
MTNTFHNNNNYINRTEIGGAESPVWSAHKRLNSGVTLHSRNIGAHVSRVSIQSEVRGRHGERWDAITL